MRNRPKGDYLARRCKRYAEWTLKNADMPSTFVKIRLYPCAPDRANDAS
jgi:hypothetical protein